LDKDAYDWVMSEANTDWNRVDEHIELKNICEEKTEVVEHFGKKVP
jgi:hypothetical protein